MPDLRDITEAFVAECRKTLRRNVEKIVHCLEQLDDDAVNFRAFDGANSIANVVHHLCGNVGQWIVSGVGGAVDQRDRPAEFAQDLRATGAELVRKLEATHEAADRAIAEVMPETILTSRRIQGYEETVLSAIVHAVSHFEGHTHQIVYMTRLRLGPRYAFKWAPGTPEQISAKGAR